MLWLAAVAAAAFASPRPPPAARGGPPNIMNSEGYQRALREERKLYQPPRPVVAPAVAPQHRRLHRRWHRAASYGVLRWTA
jgi:hypothetical protein